MTTFDSAISPWPERPWSLEQRRPRPRDRLSTRAGWRRRHRAWPRRGTRCAICRPNPLQGGSAHFVAADLNDAASVTRLAKEVGDIDILVNNAGFAVWGPTETFEIASFDAMFAANVRAPFFLVSAFAPGMVARGTGSIINISSMAGRLGLAGGAAYGATKAAAGFIDSGMGRGVQPARRQGQCCRAWPDLHAARGAGTASTRSGPPRR